MNFIIIDTDCFHIYPNADSLREKLGDRDAVVYYINEEDMEGCGWDLSYVVDKKDVGRCVLITRFISGIKKYHRDIIANNADIRSWIISVADVEFESFKSQFTIQLDSLLAGTPVRYKPVFDSSSTLEITAAEISVSLSAKRNCLIVSTNASGAKEVSEAVKQFLPDWDVNVEDGSHSEMYDDADIIIATGTAPDDFKVMSPANSLGRTYVWIVPPALGATAKQISRLKTEAVETLHQNNWEFLASNVFAGYPEYEVFYRRIHSGEATVSMLRADNSFVMWDEYGLSVDTDIYSDSDILDFIDKTAFLTKITGRI